VRAAARWTRTQTRRFRMGYWYIVWHYQTNRGMRTMPALCLHVMAYEPLDINLDPPDFVRGYELLPHGPKLGNNPYVSLDQFEWGDELHGQLRLPGL